MDFARDLARDSLGDLRDGVRPPQYRRLGMAEHVDESRGNDLILCIDDAPSSQFGDSEPYIRDAVASHGDDAAIPGIPRAIDDAGVGDEEIVRCGMRPRRN